MKAFFKDNNKIIINSMDFTETIIGKQFLEDLKGKLLVAAYLVIPGVKILNSKK